MEVGAQGLDVMIGIIRNDRSDTEIIGYVLDILCNVTSKDTFEEERKLLSSSISWTYLTVQLSCDTILGFLTGEIALVPIEQIAELGERFTEIYLKKPSNVALILGLLDEFDFHVRWPAVKLLTHLILNK